MKDYNEILLLTVSEEEAKIMGNINIFKDISSPAEHTMIILSSDAKYLDHQSIDSPSSSESEWGLLASLISLLLMSAETEIRLRNSQLSSVEVHISLLNLPFLAGDTILQVP